MVQLQIELSDVANKNIKKYMFQNDITSKAVAANEILEGKPNKINFKP